MRGLISATEGRPFVTQVERAVAAVCLRLQLKTSSYKLLAIFSASDTVVQCKMKLIFHMYGQLGGHDKSRKLACPRDPSGL